MLRKISFILFLAYMLVLYLPCSLSASWNLGLDIDARMWISDNFESEIYVAGVSLRRIISDPLGDRIILFFLAEGYDNLTEWMLHEIYAQYKGPMGRYNVTLGRFGIPYGLNIDFTTSRFLYDDPGKDILGINMDSGVMVHGFTGNIDYGLSMTQGYGAHGTPDFPGKLLITGRLGYIQGDFEDIRMGISFAAGRKNAKGHMEHDHHHSGSEKIMLLAFDITYDPGHWNTRFEFQFGEKDNDYIAGVFGMLDYALGPRFDLNLSGKAYWSHEHNSACGFIGASYLGSWFTFRGGYIYETRHRDHSIAFQIYRLFSFPF